MILLKKFDHYFPLILIYNESLYYWLYFCTNPTFEKNLVPETWVKVLSASHIADFLNKLYQNEQTTFWGRSGLGQKLVWPLWSRYSKSGSQERIDWINWFFAPWHKLRKTKNYFSNFRLKSPKKREAI